MAIELDYTFRAMGSDVRLLIGGRLLASAPPPLEAADRQRAFVREFSDRLSRFRADSDLSVLNRDGRACGPRVAVASRGGQRRAVGGRAQRRSRRPNARSARSSTAGTTTRSMGSNPPRSRRHSRTRRRDGLPSPIRLRGGRGRGRRSGRHDHPSAWRDDRHRGDRARACAPTRWRSGWGGTPGSSSTAAATSRSGESARNSEPYEVAVEHPLTRELDRLDQGRSRWYRHVWPERPHLAAGGRWLCPSSARPEHRVAGLERVDRRDGTRRQRARGRDAVEDGLAAGARRMRDACSPRTGA